MATATSNKTMSPAERAALAEQIGDAVPRLLLRTATRVDTGRWMRRSRLWMCITDEDLVLLAVSKRRFVEKLALDDCRGMRYCQASGRLVLVGCEGVRFSQIDLPPTDALNVMSLIGEGGATGINTKENEPENNRA